MTEPERTAKERITTVEDGDTTVNERLSTGGPGPEGQPDTVVERLSGSGADTVEETEPVEEQPEAADPAPSPKRAAR